MTEYNNMPESGGARGSQLSDVLVIPLREQVVFPQQRFSISLGRVIFERLYRHCEEHGTQCIGLVCQPTKRHEAQLIPPDTTNSKEGGKQGHSRELKKAVDAAGVAIDLYKIGTYCRLLSHRRSASSVTLSVVGISRIELQSVKLYDYYGMAMVRLIPEPSGEVLRSAAVRVACLTLREAIRGYATLIGATKNSGGGKGGIRGLGNASQQSTQIRTMGELLGSLLDDRAQRMLWHNSREENALSDIVGGSDNDTNKDSNTTTLSISNKYNNAAAQNSSSAGNGGDETNSTGRSGWGVVEQGRSHMPHVLADAVCALYQFATPEQQLVLQEFDVVKRLHLVASLLTQLTQTRKIKQEIQSSVQTRSSNDIKEAILRRQIGDLQRELRAVRGKSKGDKKGGDDDEEEDSDEDEITTMREKIESAALPGEPKKIALRELKRMSQMQAHHPDYNVCRTYLDTVTSLPWDKQTDDSHLDIANASRILNEDHFGLDKIKKRVLEYLAVRKLRRDMRGPILCLYGPPGVGKTSLGKSVARAMGRKFQRVALGGVRDEAELRGHRRTYVGSLPGMIIQALQSAQVNNPVVLFDEIDKLAHNGNHNPQGCLLEILDGEQNYAFKDHYLAMPFDLSNVFFMCTCNDLRTMDRPLLDRMEILELSGYSVEEKVFIAQRHLLPKQRKLHALEDGADDGTEAKRGAPLPGSHSGDGGGTGATVSSFGSGAQLSGRSTTSCGNASPAGTGSAPWSPRRAASVIPCSADETIMVAMKKERSSSYTADGGLRAASWSLPGSTGGSASSSGLTLKAVERLRYHLKEENAVQMRSLYRDIARNIHAELHQSTVGNATEAPAGAPPMPTTGGKDKRPPRLDVTHSALVQLITRYTAESGVRSLERRIAEICRWVALDIVEKKYGPDFQYSVGPSDLVRICGMEPIRADEMLKDATDLHGVAIGLAVTHAGGEIMLVEAAKTKGSEGGQLTITGQLGSVMTESVRTAMSLLRPYIPDRFARNDVHVHFPAGATPKDGPSAGVATVLALASIYLERPCRADTACTGEISLRGRVLPVGGIKEKVLAANRCPGIKFVLVPALNEPNVEEDLSPGPDGQLPGAGLKIVYLRTVKDALEHTFGSGAHNVFLNYASAYTPVAEPEAANAAPSSLFQTQIRSKM
ncbi:unnamed protein product [Amoebophrya sp. A25]|nr:unnamed protein product [Amoebophrya sp. A25]|eukprot:GSA25T00014132001.1